jgi:RND family efflux transporter MFP subunit
MKPFLKIGWSAALLAAIMLWTGCRKAGPNLQRPPAAVTASQPAKREIIDWDEYPGRLEAVDMVEIRARVSGYLDSVHFKDGAEVKKGDLLMVIDPRPYQAELDRSQALLEQAVTRQQLASSERERVEKLLKSKAVSEEEADTRSKAEREAQAMTHSAQASVEMAKLNLEYTQIHAPISGRIGRKLITEGNLVNGNQGQATLLATIVSLDPIYCYFDPDERAVLKYQKMSREGGENMEGGKVPCELGLANEPGFPHQGRLEFTDNQVNPTTGTLRMRGLLENPGPKRVLEPGFFARIRIPGSSRYPALLIPDVAVGTDQERKFVYVLTAQDTVDYRPVQLGPLFEGARVVRNGLQPDDWVVVNGLTSLQPGAKVIPTRTNSMARASAAKPANATAQ